MAILLGKMSESIEKRIFVLNQVGKGKPTPNKIAKKRIFLPIDLPFIFLMLLLTNNLSSPKPIPIVKIVVNTTELQIEQLAFG